MWKTWYELTSSQKLEARELDSDVRIHPSEFVYYVDEDGHVLDYDHVYQKGY